jgi:hypothetical protein
MRPARPRRMRRGPRVTLEIGALRRFTGVPLAPTPGSAPRSPWLRCLRLTTLGVVTAFITATLYVHLVGFPARAAAAPVAGDMRAIDSSRPGLRVLFIGNSLTYVNSLPDMVHELAAHDPGGPPVLTYQYTPGGAWLYQAAASPIVWRLIMGHGWNDVVVQEDSHVSDEYGYAKQYSVPAVLALDALIAHVRATPIVFETWGYRTGNGALNPLDTYRRMQERAQYAAQVTAGSIDAAVSPVGYAWSLAHRAEPRLNLWGPDMIHPGPAGSYLAAAVFYEVLTGRDPRPSTYTAGLDPATARWLRAVAHVAVVAAEPRGAGRPQLPAIGDDPWSA